MRSIMVNKNEAGQRLDKLLAKYLNLAGKGFLYKMMRKKNIVLNGKKCTGKEISGAFIMFSGGRQSGKRTE